MRVLPFVIPALRTSLSMSTLCICIQPERRFCREGTTTSAQYELSVEMHVQSVEVVSRGMTISSQYELSVEMHVQSVEVVSRGMTISAQYEHTLYLCPNRQEVLSGGDDY
jgi:hypothetical protein